MSKVLTYHVVFCTRGFWLPNDPRGSWSQHVRAGNLAVFGPATTVSTRCSLATKPHDIARRRAAKAALLLPEIRLTGQQALSVANGFAERTRRSGYAVYACSILPQHVHMVVARHRMPIEQTVRLLRQTATLRLLADGLHPFASERSADDWLPSIWAQGFWKTFLFDESAIAAAVRYAESNPRKDGKRQQIWKFVTPFVPGASPADGSPMSDASEKRSLAR